MTFHSKHTGFTLVELLVVMTISMIAIGLVGGLSVDGYTKYQAKSEFMQLKALVLKVGMESFIQEKRILIGFEDRELVLSSGGRKVFTQTFEYLEFPKSVITYGKRGYPSEKTLLVNVRGKPRILPLNSEQ